MWLEGGNMAITYLHLKNFKCFEDVELNFPKITLLTGPNSSGKSSLMHGILAALQSSGFPLTLSPNGDYVEMGDFIEFSFGHKSSNDISIDLKIGDEKKKNEYIYNTTWIYDQTTKMPDLNYLYAKSRFIETKIEKNKKYHVSIKLNKKNFSKSKEQKAYVELIQIIHEIDEKFKKNKKSKKKTNNNLENLDKYENIEFDISNIEEFEKKIAYDKYGITSFLSNMVFNILKFEKQSVNYICSFRIQPDRTYYQRMKAGEKIGKYGEKYIDQILEWRNKRTKEYRDLTKILRELKLLYWLTIRKFSGGRYEPRVAVHQAGPWSSLLDIGFGINQFLPILVADLQLGKGSTLLVAQPEIHLHPSAQALVADYFIKSALDKNKRYIIETHSEYLINRIRAAIVKGKLDTKDIAVYYFENTTKGSIKQELQFTKNGQILNAPKEFFNTYMMDVMDIALNSEK